MVTGDGYFHTTPTGGSYSVNTIFDEYHAGTLDQRNYLGLPLEDAVDPSSTSAWSNGVYKREFENGLVLVNPQENGSASVDPTSLGSWKFINGTQDPTVNSGANVTGSITIAAGDGRILLRQ